MSFRSTNAVIQDLERLDVEDEELAGLMPSLIPALSDPTPETITNLREVNLGPGSTSNFRNAIAAALEDLKPSTINALKLLCPEFAKAGETHEKLCNLVVEMTQSMHMERIRARKDGTSPPERLRRKWAGKARARAEESARRREEPRREERRKEPRADEGFYWDRSRNDPFGRARRQGAPRASWDDFFRRPGEETEDEGPQQDGADEATDQQQGSTRKRRFPRPNFRRPDIPRPEMPDVNWGTRRDTSSQPRQSNGNGQPPTPKKSRWGTRR